MPEGGARGIAAMRLAEREGAGASGVGAREDRGDGVPAFGHYGRECGLARDVRRLAERGPGWAGGGGARRGSDADSGTRGSGGER